ncbi:MAG: hypothetical protein JF621_01250 [Streptomyces turgidiscabies]|nr:hypothetical protein [Streptomyces turgidiscabies]
MSAGQWQVGASAALTCAARRPDRRGETVTQLRVPDKTGEIGCVAGLLAPSDLTGATVPADALHAHCGHTRFLVEDKHAHCALTVKRNQAGLYERLHSLPWKQVSTKFYDCGEGHGHKETRVVQALTVEDLDARRPGRPRGPAPQLPQDRQAQPRDGLRHHRPDQLAGIPTTTHEDHPIAVDHREPAPLRPRHHLRENASKIHTGHGPENMATLRSFAINQLRTAGHTHIAAGLREMSYQPLTRPLALIGLT